MKNHILHELTHGAGNPRNSEGAFATLTDGRLLFAYTRYTDGRGGDNDKADIAGVYSSDNGRTWGRSRILEQQPDHGYCYTAIHFTDDAVLLAYCCGGGESGHVLQDLRIRRVPLKWLYGRGA
jgi:hypothetical protein